MTQHTTALRERADDLLNLAHERGHAVDEGLSTLPHDDPIARIGYLAHALDVEASVAFDTETDLKEA